MNGLYAAIVGGVIRALMAFLAGQGVGIADAQTNAVIDAFLIIGATVWTIADKFRTKRKIADAKAGF